MRHRELSFIFLIILLFGIVFSGCTKQNLINKPATAKPTSPAAKKEIQVVVEKTPSKSLNKAYERKNLSFFKGVWPAPGTTGEALDKDVEKMRADGVNTICISPPYIVLPDGSLKSVGERPEWEGHAEKLYVEYIRKAHKAGFAVYLTLDPVPMDSANPWKIEPLSGERKNKFIEEFNQVVLRWAEIAEEEKVELFSPMNEPETLLGCKDGVKWSENILPEVKKRFKGDVIVKFADIGPPELEKYGDLAGYDYLAIDVYADNPKEVKERLRTEVIPRVMDLVEKYRMKGFVFGEMGGDVKDKERLAEILDAFFNESWNYTKGYFVSGWGKNPDPNDPTDCTFTDTPAEDVVRKWFGKV